MQHGLGEFCHEMLTREAPIALAAGMPAVGRFFPKSCAQSTLPNGDLFVQFDGFGYAFTPLSKKLTFTMSGAVEYDQDFRVGPDCDIFAYFRTKNVKSSNFQTHVVEQPVASFLNSLTTLSSDVGRQLVSGKLGEGFTVIQDRSQNFDFTLGILPDGQKPVHPIDVHGDGRIRYEGARSEVHQDQRDFIGPIEVQDSGRALYVTATLDGLPALDILVMRKEDAEIVARPLLQLPAVRAAQRRRPLQRRARHRPSLHPVVQGAEGDRTTSSSTTRRPPARWRRRLS